MGAVVRLEQYRQKREIEVWRQAAYAAVDQMIEKLEKEIEGKGFEELSDLLRREGQQVSGAVLEEVLKSRGAKARAATRHVCAECGRSLTRQPELHRRTLESRHGEIELERPYFYCKHCRKGYYPLDEELELAPERKQYDLQRAAAELFTEVPFKRASQIFERLTGIKMSAHCQQEVAAKLGKAADLVRRLPS
jgi:hypothetical protein